MPCFAPSLLSLGAISVANWRILQELYLIGLDPLHNNRLHIQGRTQDGGGGGGEGAEIRQRS